MNSASREGDRIAKVIARAGVASRREAERLIAEGRVTVDGTTLTTPAHRVLGSEDIRVDGERFGTPEGPRLWRYYKPVGLVTTHKDPQDRPTVFQNLPPELGRVVSVGRLDLNTEGLLLVTNDGGLSRVLELPSTAWKRRYRVRAYGRTSQTKLDRLKDGVTYEGVTYGSVEAKLDSQQGANSWITLSIREGKNREVRQVMRSLDLTVNRLIRVAYGPFQLGALKEGAVEEVPGKILREQLGKKISTEVGL